MLFIARYFQPRRLLEKSWQFVFSNCWKILKNWQSAITLRLLRMLFASEVMILKSTPRIGTRDAVNLHSDHYEGFVSLWQSTLEICWLIKYFIFLHFPSVFQTSSLINWDAESHTRSLDNIIEFTGYLTCLRLSNPTDFLSPQKPSQHLYAFKGMCTKNMEFP